MNCQLFNHVYLRQWGDKAIKLKINSNNNNNHDNVYGVIIMTKVIARVHPVYLMNADSAPGGRQSSDQANQLGLRVRRKLAATVHTNIRKHYCISINISDNIKIDNTNQSLQRSSCGNPAKQRRWLLSHENIVLAENTYCMSSNSWHTLDNIKTRHKILMVTVYKITDFWQPGKFNKWQADYGKNVNQHATAR